MQVGASNSNQYPIWPAGAHVFTTIGTSTSESSPPTGVISLLPFCSFFPANLHPPPQFPSPTLPSLASYSVQAHCSANLWIYVSISHWSGGFILIYCGGLRCDTHGSRHEVPWICIRLSLSTSTPQLCFASPSGYYALVEM